jgi:hypothetical protein
VIFAGGFQRISYDYFRNALYFYAFYILKLLKKNQACYTMQEIFLDSEKQKALLALCSAPVTSPAGQILTSRHYYQSQIESDGCHNLYILLKLSHVIDHSTSSKFRLNATDHWDKIFGLLGLTRGKKKLGIEPNYGKHCSKAYIEGARALIASGHVDLLWFCQFPKSIFLPIWTPDWSAHIQIPYRDGFSERSRPFAASGKTTGRVVRTDNYEGFITLERTFFDEVDVVGSAWVSPPKGKLFEAASLFIWEINLVLDEASTNGTKKDHNVLAEARWRTPIGDEEWNEGGTAQRATESSRKIYEEVLRRIEMQKDPGIPAQQLLSMQNFLVETKNGYVGLGPVEMVPSDVACIFLGI